MSRRKGVDSDTGPECLAGGAFDDTSLLDPRIHLWMDRGWFRYPDDADSHDTQPDL